MRPCVVLFSFLVIYLSCFLYHQSKPSESPNSLECILQQFCFYLALRGPLTEPSIPVRPSVRPHAFLFLLSLIFSSFSFSILLLHRKDINLNSLNHLQASPQPFGFHFAVFSFLFSVKCFPFLGIPDGREIGCLLYDWLHFSLKITGRNHRVI